MEVWLAGRGGRVFGSANQRVSFHLHPGLEQIEGMKDTAGLGCRSSIAFTVIEKQRKCSTY